MVSGKQAIAPSTYFFLQKKIFVCVALSLLMLSISTVVAWKVLTLWPSRSGRVVYSAVLVAQMVVGSSPKPPPMLADMSAGVWIKKARLPCWPLYSQQVLHQRWISGIHCTQVTKHASEGSTLALKPRGDVARSPKQGYQCPTKRSYVLQKILKKVLTLK